MAKASRISSALPFFLDSDEINSGSGNSNSSMLQGGVASIGNLSSQSALGVG